MRPARCLGAVAVAASLTAATACSTGGSGASSDGKTLEVFVASAKDAFKTAAKDFEKANPDTNVKVSYAPTDSFVTTIRTRLTSGTAPDVFYVYPGAANPAAMENVAEAGYLADLSDEPWVSRQTDFVDQITSYKDKTYILTMTYDAIGALYNKTAFAKVGSPIPKTWSDLIAFCHEAKRNGKVAFALGNQTSTDTQFMSYALVPSIVHADQPDFSEKMQAGEVSFAGSGWVTAFEKYLKMRDEGCFNKQPNGTSHEQALSMVASGKAVAFVGPSPSLGALSLQNDKAEFGMFVVPGSDDAEDVRLAASTGVGVGINADSDNKPLAKKFLRYLAKPANMNKFVETNGSAPAIPNDGYEPGPGLEVLLEYQEKEKTVQWPGQTWPNAKVQPVHLSGIQDLFAGKVTPRELAKKMDDAYRAK